MTNATSAPSVDADLLRGLHALADENRLRILEVLRDGEHCVCELQVSLEMGQSLLSHHLRSLREAGLVRDRREGRWVHYSLSTSALRGLSRYLDSLESDEAGARPPGMSCTP
jgi:ArsR family transcriptional regulator, arsenate/arsenite/antimonite-responsive transcriptional repressor